MQHCCWWLLLSTPAQPPPPDTLFFFFRSRAKTGLVLSSEGCELERLKFITVMEERIRRDTNTCTERRWRTVWHVTTNNHRPGDPSFTPTDLLNVTKPLTPPNSQLTPPDDPAILRISLSLHLHFSLYQPPVSLLTFPAHHSSSCSRSLQGKGMTRWGEQQRWRHEVNFTQGEGWVGRRWYVTGDATDCKRHTPSARTHS